MEFFSHSLFHSLSFIQQYNKRETDKKDKEETNRIKKCSYNITGSK